MTFTCPDCGHTHHVFGEWNVSDPMRELHELLQEGSTELRCYGCKRILVIETAVHHTFEVEPYETEEARELEWEE